MTLESDKALCDVAVVGAGPAGLGAALYTARSGLKTLVFGDPYESQLAKAGIVQNYLTFKEDQTQGLEITERMVDHVLRYGAQFVENEIRQITKEGDTFTLVTEKNEAYATYAVILATGTKYRKLGVPGEDEFYGKGVSYCTICDGPLYARKPVAIIGHDNEAAAAALRLSTLASRVTFLIDRPRLNADSLLIERLDEASNVDICLATRIETIQGDETGVRRVKFTSREHQVPEAPVEAVFIEIGTLPASAIAQDLGLELSGQFIKVGQQQETNVLGVFAAGDVTGIRGRQAAVSVGDGTQAALSAIDYIKSLGLSADQSRLRSVQWGALEPVTAEVKTNREQKVFVTQNMLQQYISKDEAFLRNYQRHSPRLELVAQIAQTLPEAHMLVFSAFWCPDCRRNVPKMAKIAEHLPGWTFELHADEDPIVNQEYKVKAIPTFVVYVNNREIGRIVENPVLGSLEEDLLAIVTQKEPTQPSP